MKSSKHTNQSNPHLKARKEHGSKENTTPAARNPKRDKYIPQYISSKTALKHTKCHRKLRNPGPTHQ